MQIKVIYNKKHIKEFCQLSFIPNNKGLLTSNYFIITSNKNMYLK